MSRVAFLGIFEKGLCAGVAHLTIVASPRQVTSQEKEQEQKHQQPQHMAVTVSAFTVLVAVVIGNFAYIIVHGMTRGHSYRVLSRFSGPHGV